MCTPEETQKITHKENELLLERLLDYMPRIISSVVKTMKHETSPETHSRLVNLETLADQNKQDHLKLIGLLDDLVIYYKEHKELLEEIRKGIEAKRWLRKWLKDWWLFISIVMGILYLWIKERLEK